jgi:hypothetical protein
MPVDLFHKPTQCEEIYEFIKLRGRVLTHELNHYADIIHINNPGGRARELKAKGKIWRMRKDILEMVYGKDCKEECWSVVLADKNYDDKRELPNLQ